jgi:nitrogenase delta subunit
MKEKIEALVAYIQERCLWQFFSRSWDREENIEAILTKTKEIFCGEPSSTETMADKCWYADAKILVADFKTKFPWIKTCSKEETVAILSGVKDRMREITVSKSKNEELHVKNY